MYLVAYTNPNQPLNTDVAALHLPPSYSVHSTHRREPDQFRSPAIFIGDPKSPRRGKREAAFHSFSLSLLLHTTHYTTLHYTTLRTLPFVPEQTRHLAFHPQLTSHIIDFYLFSYPSHLTQPTPLTLSLARAPKKYPSPANYHEPVCIPVTVACYLVHATTALSVSPVRSCTERLARQKAPPTTTTQSTFSIAPPGAL